MVAGTLGGGEKGGKGPGGNVQMLVGALWPAAVNALSWAMLIEVILAPSMRSKAMRWHAESTIAMSAWLSMCILPPSVGPDIGGYGIKI